MKQKEPACGQHMVYVLIIKRILELFLLTHLCGPLMMQGAEDLERYRTAGVREMEGAGLVNRIRKCFLGTNYSPRWLSSFFPDYLAMFLVFPCSIVFTVYLWVQKFEAHKHQFEDERLFTNWNDPTYGWLISVDAFLYIYTAVLMTGFLCTTLEFHIVASPEHRTEFTAVLSLFIVLWAMNFFTTQDDRYVYAAAWGYSKMSPFFRGMAALGQVFITHSTVMLGAVLLGHSEHVRRTPDMHFDVFFFKFLPSLSVLLVVIVLCALNREDHNHNVDCLSPFANALDAAWPWFEFLLPFLGGLFLLITSFVGRATDRDFDIEMDYDSTLMVATVSLAVFFNFNRIYEMEAARVWKSVLVEALQLLGPCGLATFAFYSWKQPPLRDGPGKFRNKYCLWFAFVYAGSMFAIFQTAEDCETSSDLPQCCSYPGLNADYNAQRGLQVTCDKELRCMKPFVEGKQICALPHHLESLAANITEQKKGIHFDQDTCRELKGRWKEYSSIRVGEGNRSAFQDAEHEEEKFSSAFRLFRTVGTAASVEMYFTISGVLLKLIFLTQHRQSGIILEQDQAHHGEMHHRLGESMINASFADRPLVGVSGVELQQSEA